ncbi:MAG: hypothetical protein LBB60_11930 [Desulfovibrio sp.]|jgi:hypothetical protein|nr:hypothetical protein [Desulfovibrio sp.]
MKKHLRLRAGCGRLLLTLRLFRTGNDVQILLDGGHAHIGVVALAAPGKNASGHLDVPSHREGELASRMARRVANALCCTVCVSAGIHYENISKEEIRTVEQLADTLTRRCVTALGGETV